MPAPILEGGELSPPVRVCGRPPPVFREPWLPPVLRGVDWPDRVLPVDVWVLDLTTWRFACATCPPLELLPPPPPPVLWPPPPPPPPWSPRCGEIAGTARQMEHAAPAMMLRRSTPLIQLIPYAEFFMFETSFAGPETCLHTDRSRCNTSLALWEGLRQVRPFPVNGSLDGVHCRLLMVWSQHTEPRYSRADTRWKLNGTAS